MLRHCTRCKVCLSSESCFFSDFDSVSAASSFNGPFPFFELPCEIRDHIYSHVFETQIIDVLPCEDYSAELGKRYSASKLLGPIIGETLPVSRRFLHEAILAFFSTSVFRFTISTPFLASLIACLLRSVAQYGASSSNLIHLPMRAKKSASNGSGPSRIKSGLNLIACNI